MTTMLASAELIERRACGYGLTWVSPESYSAIRPIFTPDFVFLDGNKPLTVRDLEVIAPNIDEPPAIFASIDGPVQTVVSEMGVGAHAVLSANTPQNTAVLTSANNSLLQGIDRLAKLPLAGVVIVDDLCGGSGPLVNPMVVVGALLELYHDAIKQARSVGLPCIFRSSGDAREYYSGLKEAGFWGVHIGRCDAETTSDLFEQARLVDLVPMGGLRMQQVRACCMHTEEQRRLLQHEACQMLRTLATSGKALICDDGTLQHLDDMRMAASLIHEVQAEERELHHHVCDLFE